MSALAEALVAAQRRALTQLEKEFVRSRQQDPDERAAALREALAAIGLPDRTDADALINCLEVLRITGGDLPSEPTNGATVKPPELASQKQRDWIADLFAKSIHVPLDPNDVAKMSRAQASKLIDVLQAGTYDAAEWDLPF